MKDDQEEPGKLVVLRHRQESDECEQRNDMETPSPMKAQSGLATVTPSTQELKLTPIQTASPMVSQSKPKPALEADDAPDKDDY